MMCRSRYMVLKSESETKCCDNIDLFLVHHHLVTLHWIAECRLQILLWFALKFCLFLSLASSTFNLPKVNFGRIFPYHRYHPYHDYRSSATPHKNENCRLWQQSRKEYTGYTLHLHKWWFFRANQVIIYRFWSAAWISV